ncbi:hypothetical protein AB0H88_03980 [Nonomuraea sp. NPDC050680]|uniref:hypothetical protein n=1 Tax=Nonomuraea sp. NPDC050680 TaxID=3154630 RepID=UPI0033ECAB91
MVKDWLGRFLKLYAGLALPVAGLGDLLHDAGTRLRAEGLTCDGHEAVLGVDEDEVNRWEETAADLPLLDLLLDRGVPLARPRLLHTFKLYDRLASGAGTDLAAVAADPDWAPLLRDAIVGNVTNQLNVTCRPGHGGPALPPFVRAAGGRGPAGVRFPEVRGWWQAKGGRMACERSRHPAGPLRSGCAVGQVLSAPFLGLPRRTPWR